MSINIFIIRHFKTFVDSNDVEKINYEKGFEHSKPFVDFIGKFIEKNSKINKIKFITSPQDRTIITSLIISSDLKTNILKDKIRNIEIIDPIIDKKIDRDPHKKRKNYRCNYLKKQIYSEFDENTIYIYITHSSVIYNSFKCIIDSVSNKITTDFNEKIHGFSLSYLIKSKDKIVFEFNKNMKK
jgi:hypothetical protein